MDGTSRDNSHVDVALEASDKLSMHAIMFTFAAYRSSPSGRYPPPNSIHVSYQFYTCAPSRSEVMRLNVTSSKDSSVNVLTREDSIDRNEATLAMRHKIDTSLSSPNEGQDFATYLARSTLFVDVWDADSLLYIGTCGIPLRKLMRQGEAQIGSSIECDIVNTESFADHSNGIATTLVHEGEVASGETVGSLQLLLSNHGFEGKGVRVKLSPQRNVKEDEVPSDAGGLNWRTQVVSKKAAIQSHRPRNVVRARPLTESTPELMQALSSYRHNEDGITRSLSSVRGGDGLHTLSYDEVVLLFKRFQGNVKGTIQYKGPLLTLLDVPTWTAGHRVLMEAYRVFISEGIKLEKV